MVKIRERIEEWQNSVSTLATQVESLTAQVQEALARPSGNPEKIAELETKLAETLAKLETAQETLANLQANPAPKSAVENPSPATKTETSSGTETPPAPPAPQTRAAKRGWL